MKAVMTYSLREQKTCWISSEEAHLNSAFAESVESAFRTDISCLKTENEMMLISKRRKQLMAL